MASGYSHAAGILIMLGTNDWTNYGTTGGEMTSAIASLVDYSRGLGLVPVCVSPIYRFDELEADGVTQKLYTHADCPTTGYTLDNFRNVVRGVAAQKGAKFIEGKAFPGNLHPEWYMDGVHLNAEGHAAFAPWLVQSMRDLGLW